MSSKIDFVDYDTAMQWVEEKSVEFGSKDKFLASEEYGRTYPMIREMHKATLLKYQQKAHYAMKEAGVKEGDRVEYLYQSPYFSVMPYRGVIVMRNEVPYVVFDNGLKTQSGKKSVLWHKGFKKIYTGAAAQKQRVRILKLKHTTNK